MPDYRRVYHPGGVYFFTVNLLQRKDNDLLIRHINELRQAVKCVKQDYPFDIRAWVVLPDHLHCMWKLPENDSDYGLRWRLINSTFSKSLPMMEYRSSVRLLRHKRGIW